MDFSIIKKADITDIEVGRVLGVSAVMVWKYRQGAEPRGVYKGVDLHQRCSILLEVLQELLDRKHLPKPELATSSRMDAEVKAQRRELVDGIKNLVDEIVAATPTNK